MAERTPARMWLTILGVVLVLTAILGLIPAVSNLLHKMAFHIEAGEMLIHFVLAALTLGLAFGVKDDALLATLTIVYGAVYLLVGLFGFFVNDIAGWHVAIGDNLLHLGLGGITMAAGFMSRNQAVVAPSGRRQ